MTTVTVTALKVELKLEEYCRIIVPSCYDFKCTKCENHPPYYTQECRIAVFPKEWLKDQPDWIPFPAQLDDKPAEYDEGRYSWIT